jgi:hypothetical protein
LGKFGLCVLALLKKQNVSILYIILKTTMKKILLIIAISLFGFSLQALAQGDLLITPMRVVFDEKKQKEELSIVNTGEKTVKYTISFVQKNMKEDGSFVNIETPEDGQMFSDPYLRIFPRTVTIAPGKSQVIMLQYTRKKDMKDGEYRSHLYFRAEKDSKPLGMENPVLDTTKLSVELTPIYGMSIPVIIHSGSVNSSSSLSDLKFENQENMRQYLSLTINRKGNISMYGDVIVQYIPKNGKPYLVSSVNGVGVYTDINKRNMVIKLDNISGKTLTSGKLKIQYVNNYEKKHVVYAEAFVDID